MNDAKELFNTPMKSVEFLLDGDKILKQTFTARTLSELARPDGEKLFYFSVDSLRRLNLLCKEH